MKLFASILLSSVLLLSCRTTRSTMKEDRRETTKDSLVQKETVRFDTVKIKADTAQVTIPFSLLRDSLLNYMEKSNGRAKVIIQRVGNDLVATANCDSLEKIVASKDRELQQWKQYALQQTSSQQTVKIDVPWWFKLLLISIVVIGLLLIINQILPLNFFRNGKK